MGFLDFITKALGGDESDNTTASNVDLAIGESRKEGIFKAYIPNFLYRPPYGMPRRVNTPLLKELAKNAYIFPVIKTICDEVVCTPWDVRVKEEFMDEGVDYSEDINQIKKFLRNPNGNAQSFEHILRQVVTDILETDSGVIVKVFNEQGKLQHLFGRDGSLFLMNPDIYGYIGNRKDFVPPMPDAFTVSNVDFEKPTQLQMEMINTYDVLFKEDAAYFQYGWTAGSMPVPFGKREIIYFMQNPRGDSIYGRSPLEILNHIILTLIYGSEFNLDFYLNNNMPEGVIALLGAKQEQIKNFRERFESQFQAAKDVFGNKRKKFFKFPIVNTKPEFVTFTPKPQEMEILGQQEWFTKIVWAAFGVTAAEMGWTESVNKASAEQEVKVSKRKAIKPILSLISYHLNTQLMNEFFDKGYDEFDEIPLEFVFDEYDAEEDKTQHDILEQEIRMGVKTPEMAAKELGINVEELKKHKEEQEAKEAEKFEREAGFRFGGNNQNNQEPPKKKEEEKEKKEDFKAIETKPFAGYANFDACVRDNQDKNDPKAYCAEIMRKVEGKAEDKEQKDIRKDIDSYIDDVEKDLLEAVELISEDEIEQSGV